MKDIFVWKKRLETFFIISNVKKSQKRLATIGTEGILLPIQNTVIFLNTETNQLQDTPEVGKTFGLCNLTNFF